MGELFPAFSILCGVAIVLVLLPLPWHWKARNTGTLLYIFWAALGNAVFMTNSILWAGNLEDRAPVWCDISTKIAMGQSVGIVAASLCINRKLYNIATIRSVSETAKSKRRDAIVDLVLGIGGPLVIMALHYVVQSHRYDIIEDIGCWPNVAQTTLMVAMIYIWPIIISAASLIYCSLTIRAFLQARQQFSQVLKNSNSGINLNQYFRLLALASTEIAFSLPFSLYILISNLKLSHLYPWVSWEDTHQNLSTVGLIPMALMKTDMNFYRVMMISQWVLPGCGFLFFIYFGLGGGTYKEYKKLFFRLVAPLGIKPKAEQPAQTHGLGTHLTSGNSGRDGRDRALFPSLPDLNDTTEKDTDLEAGVSKSNAV